MSWRLKGTRVMKDSLIEITLNQGTVVCLYKSAFCSIKPTKAKIFGLSVVEVNHSLGPSPLCFGRVHMIETDLLNK